MVKAWIKKARELGLEYTIYDLGGLGAGVPVPVTDTQFHSLGHYQTGNPSWRARALHKPAVVAKHLERHADGCYLDADALPVAPLELPRDRWDIAVTVRRGGELPMFEGSRLGVFMGEINAGVIFFVKSENTLRFLRIWEAETQRVSSDQRALNQLIGGNLPRDGSVIKRAGIRIKCLPTDLYNFYYFPERPPSDVRVLHLKSGMWRKGFETARLLPEFNLEKLVAHMRRVTALR